MEKLKDISLNYRNLFYKTGVLDYFLMAQRIDKLVKNIEQEKLIENKQEESFSL